MSEEEMWARMTKEVSVGELGLDPDLEWQKTKGERTLERRIRVRVGN